jgi:site-specific DNA recombinase
VWNRQRTDKDLADPAGVSLGHKQVQRWNLADGWVISAKPAHEALVSEADFIAARTFMPPVGRRRRVTSPGRGIRRPPGAGGSPRPG